MAAPEGRLRQTARRLASSSGVLSLRHRLRNRDTLTVAMFHRVVTPGSEAARHADPRYALPAPVFAGVLDWFVQHYWIVSFADVLAACEGGPALPTRALLLTFDDGWADNRDVALPILRAAGLPAVLFAAADAMAGPEPSWWQEVLLRALRDGRADRATLWRAGGADGSPPAGEPPELSLLLRWAALPAEDRTARLAPWRDNAVAAAEGRHMLTLHDLPSLAGMGVAVGSHGAAHLPLAVLDDPAADIAAAAALLKPHVATDPLPGLSFPHGRYDARVLAGAWAAGHRVLFTSDACLNDAPHGRPATALLGRISIELRAIADGAGYFDVSRLETWMFHRPIRRLDPGPVVTARAA
jgi:peptidoglycan/xylan/chitin deacetylase (PgdA/CDA1 family)